MSPNNVAHSDTWLWNNTLVMSYSMPSHQADTKIFTCTSSSHMKANFKYWTRLEDRWTLTDPNVLCSMDRVISWALICFSIYKILDLRVFQRCVFHRGCLFHHRYINMSLYCIFFTWISVIRRRCVTLSPWTSWHRRVYPCLFTASIKYNCP